jgi:hypothetical protein
MHRTEQTKRQKSRSDNPTLFVPLKPIRRWEGLGGLPWGYSVYRNLEALVGVEDVHYGLGEVRCSLARAEILVFFLV